MSDPNQSQNQGQQGGQPQGGQPQGGRQGRQPQGRQRQGTQQQGAQPRQGGGQPRRQQGGRPPAGGSGSPVDALTDPGPKRHILGVAGTLAVLAVAAFLTIFLVGMVGGSFVLPEGFSDASDAQKEAIQEQFEASLVQSFIAMAPFLALGLVALAGGVVGSELDRPRNDVLATAAVAGLAGAFLFVVLGVFLASTQYPSGDQSVSFGNLIINSVVIGIAAAVAGAAGAFFGDRSGSGTR